MNQYNCKIHHVADGDSLSIEPQGLLIDDLREQFPTRKINTDCPLRVRLFALDALEIAQPGGESAHRRLQQLLEPYTEDGISLVLRDIDYHGRLVGDIWVDGFNISPQLLAEGNAVIYRRFLAPMRRKDPSLFDCYTQAEQAARMHRRGFWGLPEPLQVLPHRWRQQQRANKKATA